MKKNEYCLKKNITLIRVLEKGLLPFDNCVCISRKSTTSLESLGEVITQILEYLKLDSATVDINADYNDIITNYTFSKEEKSFDKAFPHLLDEWDWKRNGDLSPEFFTSGSSQMIWWKCKVCGCEWQARIYTRCKGHGCPDCGRKLTIKGKRKKVLCVETNEEYDSITTAALKTGLNKVSIMRCCQGKQNATQGCHWRYVEEQMR